MQLTSCCQGSTWLSRLLPQVSHWLECLLTAGMFPGRQQLLDTVACVCPCALILQAAYVVCQGSRAQLRMAADEVQRQIKIITSTRKKQRSMEVLDVLSRVKKVKDLPAALR